MDAREHMTDVVIEEIIAYGTYSDHGVDSPAEIEAGYKAWTGYTDDIDSDQIHPGHCAWRLLNEVFEWFIDWERVYQEITRHLIGEQR